jgi:hypothetical protein
MRAWGNERFGSVEPFEDVCLAAEQHDIGWMTWERAPTLNPATGRPHGFRELGVERHTSIWSQGTATALAFGRYPALLVSLHGTGLYAGFDAASARTGEAEAVRAFLAEQEAIQLRLLASLRADPVLAAFADPATVERNRRLVRAADRMSIAIRTLSRDVAIRSGDPREGVVRQVPAAEGDVDLRLRAEDAGMTAFTVSPWPFAAARVWVFREGSMLPSGSFADEAEMRAALREAEAVTVAAELRPE